jgi:hypothetical protein
LVGDNLATNDSPISRASDAFARDVEAWPQSKLAVEFPLSVSRFFMKKLFGLLTAVVMVSALAIGCGEKKKTETKSPDGTTKTETTTK